MIANVIRHLRAEWKLFASAFAKPVPVVCFLVSAVALCIYFYYGRTKFFSAHLSPALGPRGMKLLDNNQLALAKCLYWCLTAWVVYVAFPQTAMRITTRYTPDDPIPTLGWGLGNWKMGVSACAIFYGVMFLILLTVVLGNEDFRGKYPLCDAATLSIPYFVMYEIGLILYFIAWEYFWRGFMTFSLEKTFGPWVIWILMVPFVVHHGLHARNGYCHH